MLPFSQVIEQERRRWMAFRRALLKEDHEAFDRMFACARQQVHAGMHLSRPWGFSACSTSGEQYTTRSTGPFPLSRRMRRASPSLADHGRALTPRPGAHIAASAKTGCDRGAHQ
jgi:hypothetical protein